MLWHRRNGCHASSLPRVLTYTVCDFESDLRADTSAGVADMHGYSITFLTDGVKVAVYEGQWEAGVLVQFYAAWDTSSS